MAGSGPGDIGLSFQRTWMDGFLERRMRIAAAMLRLNSLLPYTCDPRLMRTVGFFFSHSKSSGSV